jgi:hypothetical protein
MSIYCSIVQVDKKPHLHTSGKESKRMPDAKGLPLLCRRSMQDQLRQRKGDGGPSAPYAPDDVLSFAMQVSASTGSGNYGDTKHAISGVTVSFESGFNLTLGQVSFCYATSSSMLPNNAYQVSNTPDTYEASFSDWVALANVSQPEDIASLDIEFWAIGHTAQVPAGSAASARVRFDNVSVSPIPEPSSIAMIGLVSGCAVFVRRRFMI